MWMIACIYWFFAFRWKRIQFSYQSWIEYDLGFLRCFGQGNFYPSQRATMDQVDRIMPVGSLIPWIPKLHKDDEHEANYYSSKGWIKCDGIETCNQGMFEGQSCPSMADRGLIGSNESLKAPTFQNASIPQHNHDHQHTMNSHYHQSRNSKGSNPGNVNKVSACINGYCTGRSDVAAWHDHTTKEQTVSVTSSMLTHSAPVTSVSGADIGENLPAHMRVNYLFKCY